MIRNIAAFWLALSCFGCATALPTKTGQLEGCMKSEHYAKAMSAYDLGVSALGRGDFKLASSLFDEGIERLASTYLYDRLIDDTGMKLVLAKSEERRGALENAANIKNRVLESRLAAYRLKSNCE